jgi:hypothetical protein
MGKAQKRVAHGRSRRCHPGPPCRRLRAAASTAAPSHTPPRAMPPRRPDRQKLAYEWSESVCQSAQPPADRSVQRLRRHRRWTAPAACWAARPRSGPPSARQRARTNSCSALPHLAAPPGAPHVLVPAACSRLCLALPWHRRRRFRAGALAPPVPASTRGLPAPPRTASPIPVAVRPHTPGDSRFRLAPGHEPGLQRAHCARSSHAPPGAGRAHTEACQPPGGLLRGHSARRGGVRSCPSVDICSRHGACSTGTRAPGRAGVGRRSLWGLGAPKPLPGRSGVSFDGSYTAGLCAAWAPGAGACSLP